MLDSARNLPVGQKSTCLIPQKTCKSTSWIPQETFLLDEKRASLARSCRPCTHFLACWRCARSLFAEPSINPVCRLNSFVCVCVPGREGLDGYGRRDPTVTSCPRLVSCMSLLIHISALRSREKMIPGVSSLRLPSLARRRGRPRKHGLTTYKSKRSRAIYG